MIRDNAAQALVCAKTDLSACGSPVSQAETDCAEIIAELHQLLEGFAPDTFDLVVSNPPYVGECEADKVTGPSIQSATPLAAVCNSLRSGAKMSSSAP